MSLPCVQHVSHLPPEIEAHKQGAFERWALVVQCRISSLTTRGISFTVTKPKKKTPKRILFFRRNQDSPMRLDADTYSQRHNNTTRRRLFMAPSFRWTTKRSFYRVSVFCSTPSAVGCNTHRYSPTLLAESIQSESVAHAVTRSKKRRFHSSETARRALRTVTMPPS